MIKILANSIVVLCMFSFSCCTYKISESALRWQPYETGDTLVFESGDEQVDSIVVNDVSKYRNLIDPLSVFSKNQESIIVSGRYKAKWVDVLKRKRKWKEITLLRVLTTKKGEEVVDFQYHTDKINIYQNESFNKIDNIKKTIISDTYFSNSFPNAILLNICDNSYSKSTATKHVYWDEQFGYIGFELFNGQKWRLTAFIRNSENIIKH